MDFHMKQWREQQQDDSDSAKSLRLHLNHQQHKPSPDTSPALSLFSSEPPPSSSTTKRGGGGGGGYFSRAQWHELELQALIYKHMMTATSIPPQLLYLLLNKTLINSPHPFQHHPYFQPPLMQSGYWGKGAMDPEPGRCRRTDGKKWRCSKVAVDGHKYCDRHVHRGRNPSRKPVEITTPATTTSLNINPITGRSGDGNGGGEALKTANATHSIGGSSNPFSALAGDGGNQFALSGHSPFSDLLHLNQRTSDSMIENKNVFRSQSEDDHKSAGRILRPFFDDWPRSIHEPDNAPHNSSSSLTSATSLSNTSDISLKLSTGDGELSVGVQERERPNWGVAWGSNPGGSMGGPLAEVLRSSARSTTNTSPTSVLHQLQRGSTSEASYVGT